MSFQAKNRGFKTIWRFTNAGKDCSYASQLQAPTIDAQAALELLRSETILKQNKVRTLNFKAFYKVAAVVAVLLTSSYFFVLIIQPLTKHK
jgi:hypothetical protein